MRRVLFLLAICATACDPETPVGALERLRRALAAKDRITVERYLDLHRTVESAVDQIVAGVSVAIMNAPSNRARGPDSTRADALSRTFRVGLLSATKPLLRIYVEAAITRALAQDSMPSPSANPLAETIGGSSLEPARLSRQYRGIQRTQVRGDLALVDLEFYDDSTGMTLVPQLRMERHEGHWRLVGFTNLSEVVQQIAERSYRDRS